MKTKRNENTTMLKVKFIPATNNLGNRFKLTQTNNKKSRVISGNINKEPIDFFCDMLDKNGNVRGYSLAVDNTQQDYYIFNVDFYGHEFADLLNF